ncbi:trans-sialidase, putative, partial [Trypanosoma cruzi marinkellei]
MEISMAGNSVPFAQLLEGVATTDGKEAAGIMRPTTVVSGGNTDMPPGNYGKTNSDTQPADASNWRLLPVKGTATGEGENKRIRWSGAHAVKRGAGHRNNSLRNLIGAGGSGVVFHDGTVTFPMQATDDDGKSVLLAMQFTSSDNKWRLSYGTTDSGCRDPSVVEWGAGNKLILMSSCGEGQHQLYMSDGHGTSWCPNCVPINCVWCNSHDREGYGVPSGSTTAVIGDERVMLATLPAYSKDNERGRLHLWVTSSVRVHGVGPIPREGDEAAISSLLVKGNNDGLISLHESKKRSEGRSHGRVAFARGGGAGAGKRGGEEMDSFGQRLAIM